MSKLQELLDAKWRMDSVHSDNDKNTLEMFSRIFTEGYNAAILEFNGINPQAVKEIYDSLIECMSILFHELPFPDSNPTLLKARTVIEKAKFI